MRFETEKSPYVVFSVIGPHAGEDVQTILERKADDIRNVGESFWVAKTTATERKMIRTITSVKPVHLILLELSSNGKAAQSTKIAKKAIEYANDGKL